MKVLVLSPHTDDSELGAGGTIAKLIEDGNEVQWMVFSGASDSLPKDLPGDTLKEEFRRSIKHFGAGDGAATIFDFPVRRLHESRQEVLELLVAKRQEFRPDMVIGPSLHDYHQDHGVVAMEMVRCFKTNASIICYELPWNHVTFDAQFFSVLTEESVNRKIEALSEYNTQIGMRQYFSREFLEGLMTVRGVQVGTRWAEAFEVVRWII
jgi:LmbE family N-acetylglucosaminyl deacetylase